MIPTHCAPTPDAWRTAGVCPECAALMEARIAELEALSKRCRRELLEVLHSANKGKAHFDGDNFHELLRDLDQHLKP